MFSTFINAIVKPVVHTSSMGLIDLDKGKQYSSHVEYKIPSKFKYYQANPERLDSNTRTFHSVLTEVAKELSDKEALMQLSKEELITKYSELHLSSDNFYKELLSCFKEHTESK